MLHSPFPRARNTVDVDVIVVGKWISDAIVRKTRDRRNLEREINPLVYFHSGVQQEVERNFLKTVFCRKKLFIIRGMRMSLENWSKNSWLERLASDSAEIARLLESPRFAS